MSTSGIFLIQNVYNEQSSAGWPTTYAVPTPPGELYGWYGGGFGQTLSSVDRVDFSNDNTLASTRGPLSYVRAYSPASGNGNYGWFLGGIMYFVALQRHSAIDRIDYANDSATAALRGSLTAPKDSGASSGNTNFAWYAGGGVINVPSAISSVDRITYSNDAVIASSRGNLTEGVKEYSAVGNTSFGWYAGGTLGSGPTPVQRSRIQRIDYAADTNTAASRGPLNALRYAHSASGNANFAWFSSGSVGSPSNNASTVERVTYATDTNAASFRGTLNRTRYHGAATGTINFGWHAGGSTSDIDRIDYSNDSVTASLRGTLSVAKNTIGAAGGYPG